VRLDRDLRDPELAADLLVEQPADDQRHDFPLAETQGCIAVSERRFLRLASEGLLAAMERVHDSAQQGLIAKGLGQEL